jgi:hypothetical protein
MRNRKELWTSLSYEAALDRPEYPAVEGVVAGKGNHGPESDADGVEHLGRCVHPHLSVREYCTL